LWNDIDAMRCSSALALHAYSSRLLGGDASLVLHGGGNTSIKVDENGARVLYVKGTGSDLAQVGAHAFTPLHLAGVTRLLQQETLGNADVMRALDRCLVRHPAPRPSIETLLHAGLPFRCVGHTHADAVLAAMNVENIEAVHGEIYSDRAPLVPYRHSGHALARACTAVLQAHGTANTIGLVLAFHGIVAFADDARSAYDNMIELVTRAEGYLRARGAWDVTPATLIPVQANLKSLDSVSAEINALAGTPLAMHIVDDLQCMQFARRADIADISQQGPATPQHAVYTKRVPMIGRDVQDYAARYRAYLDKHLGKTASALIDAAPRIMLDPEFGLCAFGVTARDAQIAAEMYQHDIGVISRASTHGRYRSAPPAAIAQAEFEYGGFAARLQTIPS
ncbi:MAG TPA: class II aldolase/adducin family protein, partial [Burkholderiales bacterium]|nr:class II aldolase/adducin family protein [Burkholderiales bacterium]